MNLSAIDLNLLVALEALIEERNVTRAASRVGLSQPATSNALRRGRELLHDPLLVRTGRKMERTARAEELLPALRLALNQIRSALDDRPVFDPESARQTFTISANDYAELALMPRLMQSIAKSAPHVTVQFTRMQSLFEPPVEELAAGNIDLAIGFAEPSPRVQSAVGIQELWSEPHVVIARVRHPRLRHSITRAQYLAERHVAIAYRPERTGLIDSLLSHEGAKRDVALRLPHMTTVAHAVASTDLVSTIPAGLAQLMKRILPLQVLPCPVKMPTFWMSMLWHERSASSAGMSWIRQAVRACALGMKS